MPTAFFTLEVRRGRHTPAQTLSFTGSHCPTEGRLRYYRGAPPRRYQRSVSVQQRVYSHPGPMPAELPEGATGICYSALSDTWQEYRAEWSASVAAHELPEWLNLILPQNGFVPVSTP